MSYVAPETLFAVPFWVVILFLNPGITHDVRASNFSVRRFVRTLNQEFDACRFDFLNQNRQSCIGFITFSEPTNKITRQENRPATPEVISGVAPGDVSWTVLLASALLDGTRIRWAQFA
jgi:hypothetical protein